MKMSMVASNRFKLFSMFLQPFMWQGNCVLIKFQYTEVK